MYRIAWRYRVKVEQIEAFERAYGPEGDWVRFFRGGDGYLGTWLYREVGAKRGYLTIDEWGSKEEYESFRDGQSEEYGRIDAVCERFTEEEEFLGAQVS